MDFFLSLLKAFSVGGMICLIAQILIDKTAMTPARILVLYVSLGVILTGIGVYDPLVSFAGCGATTPLLGFGYSFDYFIFYIFSCIFYICDIYKYSCKDKS